MKLKFMTFFFFKIMGFKVKIRTDRLWNSVEVIFSLLGVSVCLSVSLSFLLFLLP